MSTIRNPVGPQPPSVYWRRRLLFGLVIVAVIVVVVLIIVRPGAGAPTAQNTPSPSPSKTAETVLPGQEPACEPDAIKLTAVTDAASYGGGAEPQISMTIENIGAAACRLNVGTDAQVYTITSGSETYWTSTDCQTDPEAREETLQPSDPQSTTAFAWDRTRSSTSTCDDDRAKVPAGGASYHLSVKLGDVESAETAQFILN